MKRIILIIVACIVLPLLIAAQDSSKFYFRSLPYLQNLSENEVTVFSVASKPCVSYVLFGETFELSDAVFASQHGQIDANRHVQKVKLSGLLPGKKYYYRVVSKEIKVYQAYKVLFGDSVMSDIHSFVTPHSDIRRFSFLTFNDVHSRPDFIDSVYRQNRDVAFICYNGDMLDDIYHSNEIIDHFLASSAASFGASIPFVYTRGNHETRGPAARELIDFVCTPNGQYFYTFNIGNTAFMVLDTGEDKPDTHTVYAGLADYDRYRTMQAAWIRSVTDTDSWKKAKHRIVCAHIPASRSHDGWHGSTEVAQKFLPLLENARVDLYLCGHTHEPVLETPNANHKFTMVVGGGPMRNEKSANVTYIRVDVDHNYLYVRLLTPKGEIINEYKVK
ncbi:MAG: metallophosphoesterase [Paludibacteraceae bacterium]|nr:metallophosphoesterase [Paludibacteraceae bacterium]